MRVSSTIFSLALGSVVFITMLGLACAQPTPAPPATPYPTYTPYPPPRRRR